MYTRCPHCLTVFLVAAEQLKAAHGNVRCGTCLESFDAIPHLSDGPVPEAPAPAEEAAAVPVPEDLGASEAATGAGDARGDAHSPPAFAAAADARSAGERLTSTLDAVRAVASMREDADRAPASAVADGRPGEEPVAEDEPAGDGEYRNGPATGRVSAPVESTPVDDATLPEVLREEVSAHAARSAARRRNVAYGVAASGLLVLLAAQYVFFMPEDAVRRYPQWRGAIESLCIQVGCVLPERRDPSRIRVVSRDVRVHPKIEGVMQIKATLMNAAPFRQPYPLVRFTLFNVNGQMIATRDFTPSEYLGRRVAASARLRPKTPFQVELDVLAPEQAAVSFEFSFI